MITFRDGPAQEVSLMLHRAPQLLRVVIDETSGRVDALDQLDDTPGPSERVHVYRRVGYDSQIWACDRGPGGHSSIILSAEYAWLADVDGEALRETGRWRTWAENEGAALLSA